MVEFTHSVGPRILDNGINMDGDVTAYQAKIHRRRITDAVSDGSLGEPGYEPGQKNLDGSDL